MSIPSQFTPFIQNSPSLPKIKEEECILDPLSQEKERLKSLPKQGSNLSFKVFPMLIGDSFLVPKNKSPTSKSFGQLTGDSLILETGYEGGDARDQAEYWNACWKGWQDPNYAGPCNPNIDEKISKEIIDDLSDFHKLCVQFKTAAAKDIRETINNALDQKQRCVIPLETHAAKNSDGHVFACVLEQDNEGQLTAFILNVGGGSNLHPLVEVDMHVKNSFMFPPISFRDPYFFKNKPEVAEHLINLLTYYAKEEPADEMGYHITEIYQLFLGLGALLDEEPPQGAASLSQRSGTCPAEALKLIHRYFFLKNADIHTYKKVIFFIKFQSYWDTYCKLTTNRTSFSVKDKALIERSLSQFAYSIEKHSTKIPKVIDDHTLLTAQALLELMSEELSLEKLATEEIKNFEAFGLALFPVKEVEQSFSKKSGEIPEFFSPRALNLTCPEPAELRVYLENLYSNCQITQYTVQNFQKNWRIDEIEVHAIGFMEAFKRLPLPKREGPDSYWDAINREDRIKIMQYIYECVNQVCIYDAITPKGKTKTAQIFLMHLTAFAILDRLASENPLMHLNNCSYPMSIDTLNKYNYFKTASDQVRLKQLQDYFKPRSGDLIIFDIIPPRADGIRLKDDDKICYDHNDCKNGLGAHFCYMDRLLDSSFPKKASLYFLLMKNDLSIHLESDLMNEFEKYAPSIPREYYLLQHTVSRAMKYLDHIDKGLVSINYQTHDYCTVNKDNDFWVLYFWRKEARLDVCDDSDSASPLLNKIYFRSIRKKIPEENEAIIKSLRERGDSLVYTGSIFSEIHKIFKENETRASLAMKFCEDHPNLIENTDIKFMIQYALLNDTALIEKSIQEPSYSNTLNTFFDHMIQETRWSLQIDSALFWIQTAIFVETHISLATGYSIPMERVLSLLKIAEKQRSSLALIPENDALQAQSYLTIALVAGMEPRKWDLEKDAALIHAFINSYLLFRTYQSRAQIDNKLVLSMKACFLQHLPEIKTYIEQKGIQAIETTLQTLGIDSNAQENSLTLEWPLLTFKNGHGKEVKLNFPLIYLDGEILEHGDWPSKMLDNKEIATILLGSYPPIIKMGQNRVIAKDNSFEISFSDEGILDFKKHFQIAKRDLELTYVSEENLNVINIPQPLIKQCEFWLDPKNGYTWMLTLKGRKPIACIMPQRGDAAIIQKTTPQGYLIENQFLNQLYINCPIATLFARIEDLSAICAWGSKDGKIDHFNFPKLNLTFQLEGKEKCLYTKNSEYRVIGNDKIANPFSTALYLEKASGNKGMILPFNVIHSEAFGTLARNEAENKIDEDHFFYELDPKTGLFRSSSQLAMLFLVYTLKCHGHHEEAYEYLKHFHGTTAFDKRQVSVLIELLSGNHETRNLSIAIHGYLAYIQAQKISSFGLHKDIKDIKQTVELEKLCIANLDRLVQLMGDDLEMNRLSYSPTIQELLSIDKQLRDNHSENGHWQRFLTRYNEKKPQMVTRTKSSILASNLQLIPIAITNQKLFKTLCIIREDNLIEFSSSAFISGKLGGTSKLISSYLKIIGSSKLSESEQEKLKLDLRIILEREEYYHELTICAAALYFAVQFPDEFREITMGKIDKDTVEAFLKSEKPLKLAKEMIESKPEQDTKKIIQKPLEIKASEKFKHKVHIDVSLWKKLKDEYRIPLEKLLSEYFDSSNCEILPKTQKFTFGTSDKASSAVNAKVNELKTAFDEKVPKSYIVHELKKDLNELSQSLENIIRNSQKKIDTIKSDIQDILDFPRSNDSAKFSKDEQQAIYAHQNRIRQGKIQAISFQTHVMPYLLSLDVSDIKEANPFLSDKHIEDLFDLGLQYMLASSRIDQAQEAHELAKLANLKPQERKILLQKAGTILAKERHYNPYKYPEMLIYEYATGYMLRNQPDQARLLKTIIKTLFSRNLDKLKRLFFEFQAGGGKTKVLSVILAARARREGMTFVFFSLPTLVDISKEDLREAFQLVYQKGIIPLSLPLNRKLKEKDLKIIIELLKKDSCIVTEPESWHALRLGQQSAIANYGSERPLFDEILEYFKKKALFFIDEEHRNGSSLIEANKAIGSPDSYPDYQAELISSVYDLLYGWTPDPIKFKNGDYLHEVLGLFNNRQATLTDALKNKILKKLAARLISLLKIPINYEEKTLAYLTHKNAESPNVISNDMLLQKKIDLARGLILEILPFTLSQKDMMDYGPSQNLNDLVFDPYILGEPAGPKFQDPDIAAALTVQGIRQHGLEESQIKHYLKWMISKFKSAKDSSAYLADLFMNEFSKLNPPDNFPFEKITIASLSNPLLISAYTKALGRNIEVIKTFESELALKKIKIYPHKLTSTSQELSFGAQCVVHTSATLGVREENPYLEQTGLFLQTVDFMADVVNRALLPHNQETHWIEESTPKAMLDQLFKNGTDFSRIDGIINIGGMSLESSSNDWAQALIAFNQEHNLNYAGAIIAKEEREKRFAIIRPLEQDIIIDGSDIKTALKKLGLSDKRFFKVYPPDMTTGTDLYLAENARMILTIGENVPLSSKVQAIMRMRGFLQNPIDPNSSQGLIWVGSTKIKKMLEERYNEASAQTAMLLATANQDLQEKEAIKMRAKQDVEMVIREIVQTFTTADCESTLQFDSLFKMSMSNDPSEKYGTGAKTVATEKFLGDYMKSLAQKADIYMEYYPEAQKRIKKANLEVKGKVPFFETSTQRNFNAMMYQHQEATQDTTQRVQQRTQQRQLKTDIYGAKAYIEEYYADGDLRLGCKSALELPENQRANHIFGIDWLAPNLFLLPNFFNTIQLRNDMKSPTYIFAVFDKKTMQRDYRLISASDALKYTRQLQKRNPRDNLQTAVLFTANGAIHQTDRMDGGLSQSEIEKLRKSDEFCEILAQVGLLSCKLIEVERQLKLINTHPERLKDLEKILKRQIFFMDETFQHKFANLQCVLSKDLQKSSNL